VALQSISEAGRERLASLEKLKQMRQKKQ